jgi:hypothetical protein
MNHPFPFSKGGRGRGMEVLGCAEKLKELDGACIQIC